MSKKTRQSKSADTAIIIMSVIIIPVFLFAAGFVIFSILNNPAKEVSHNESVTVDTSCKSIYKNILNGNINNQSQDAYGNSLSWAPPKNADETERKYIADKTTLRQVLLYHGLYNISIENLYYSKGDYPGEHLKKGDIFYVYPEFYKNKIPDTTAKEPLTYDTTLGELYG